MKYLLVTISLFVCLISSEQTSVNKIRSLLGTKNFPAFKNYIDSAAYHGYDDNVRVEWHTHREILPDICEAVITIFDQTPVKHSKSGDLNVYRINLLVAKNSIFYYDLKKLIEQYTTSTDIDNVAYETIDYFKNHKLYAGFEIAFEKTYNAALNPDDLFLTELVYGDHCGFIGRNPKEFERLLDFVEDQRIDSIRIWLRSANAEKQLYAMTGLRLLKESSYSYLTNQDEKIMALIQKKKGSVNTCGGCTYLNIPIEMQAGLIQNETTEHLRYIRTHRNRDYDDEPGNYKKPINLPFIFAAIFSIAALCCIGYILAKPKSPNRI